jgi:UDP-N-acetyl-D-mannosaminuronate dehydrogenase
MAAPGLMSRETVGGREEMSLVGVPTSVGESPSAEHRFAFDVAIVGLGYVGLPTSLALHAAGQRVLGVDVSERRLRVISDERADLRESPALEVLSELIADDATVAYYDPLFTSVKLPGGTTLIGVDDPVAFHANIVLVHTAHNSVDLSWLTDQPLVLDATYRLAALPNRVLL